MLKVRLRGAGLPSARNTNGGCGANRWLDARARDTVVALTFDGACLRGKLDADHDVGYVISRRLLEHVCDRLQRVRLQRLDLYKAI